MLLLSLDTSTTVCSVALHRDNVLLACYELHTERTASARLTTLIQDVVAHTGHQMSDLDAVAVAKGPGSYTGLRIGVSTAKGLCFALNKPLLAVNTLQAMAAQIHSSLIRFGGPIPHSSFLLCPMLDARRMEVYCALYDVAGEELQPTAAVILDEFSFADVLAERPVLFFGDGAAKARPLLGGHPNAHFLDVAITPSARTVGQLAARAFTEGCFEDVATFEPFYLKEFVGTRPRPAAV